MNSLAPGQSRRFEELFKTATTKAEVIVTFLALLELMKLNQFVVRQSELLGDIVIERRDAANAATLADSLGGSAEGEED
jgi:segregation and condensation protein A